MTLGERIYCQRKQKGLSQEALAESLGVSRQSISKWELDQSVPELDNIVSLSEIFGISTDELLKGKVEEENSPIGVSMEEGNRTNGFDSFVGFVKRYSHIAAYGLIAWGIWDAIRVLFGVLIVNNFGNITSKLVAKGAQTTNSIGIEGFGMPMLGQFDQNVVSGMKVDASFMIPFILWGLLYAAAKLGVGIYILRRKKHANY